MPTAHSQIPREDLQDIEEIKEILSVDNSSLVITVEGNRRTVMYPCRMASILNMSASHAPFRLTPLTSPTTALQSRLIVSFPASKTQC